MKIRSTVMVVSAALLICAGTGVRSQSSQAYSIVDLGTTGGPGSEAYAVNESGQVAGYVWTTQRVEPGIFFYHAFLWDTGVMTDLGTLGTDLRTGFSHANAINNLGQIVGAATTVEGCCHAFVWQNGVMVDLGTLGGRSSVAYGINAFGDVVGSAQTSDGVYHGVLWQNGVVTRLAWAGPGWFRPRDINTSGQVVGEEIFTGGDQHAVLWQNGVVTDLGTLGGMTSGAMALNQSGQIAGWAQTHDGSYHAVLWQNGFMTDLGPLGATDTLGYDVNAAGDVVGVAVIGDYSGDAFLWQNGVMADLETLLPAGSGWDLWGATAINDCGQIAGYGVFNGQRRAFLMTPSDMAQRCPKEANPSPDGTEVPPAHQVIDASGAVWTLGGAGETLRNGFQAAGGSARSLLWSGGVVYAYGWDDHWWQWTGAGWVVYGTHKPGATPQTPSADGTTVPPANQIIDTSGAVWTLGPNWETLRGGVHAAGGYAQSLLWREGALYAYAWDDQWWRWMGSGWARYSPSSPVQPTYEMTGVVTDDDGMPIPSAKVWAFLDSFSQSFVHADGAGRYSIRFTSFPGILYYPKLDPPSAAQAVVIASAEAPGYDPYSAFVSAPAEQFSRNLRLHREQRMAVGEAAVLNILPEDSMCVVDVWPGREMVCRRVHIIPSTDGLLTVTAAPTDGGEPPRFFEAWRLDGLGGQRPSVTSVRVVAGSEVIVAVGVPWGQAPRSFLITTAVTP